MKEKRFATFQHRYGKGKTHRLLYSRENKSWYVDCRGPSRGDLHGQIVDDTHPITCQKCDPTVSTTNVKGESTMTFDYSKYVTSDFMKFKEIGDQVVGIIKHVREGKDFNGNPCPELILETNAEGDEITVTAGQKRLQVALEEKKPQVGDKVRITYSGNSTDAKPGRAPAKEFTVEVQPGPHQLVQPAPADEAPF